MKRILSLFVLGILLASCNKKVSPDNQNENQALIPDTIVNEYSVTEHENVVMKKDTFLFIGGEKFILTYSAQIEPSKFFYYTDTYHKKGENHKDIYKGLNATYTILLTDNSGKMIFKRSLTKEDFREIFDLDILTKTDAKLPYFIGYLDKFKSFLFTVDFWVPDSDVGGQCFFMVNQKGEVTENSLNNYYGGADCDGEIEIPASENFILTCRKIINTNGRTAVISDKHFWQVGTKLINDNVILVIQTHNDSAKNQNAKLIDNVGKILKSFIYKGYYEVLGYTVPMYFDSLKMNYILLDEEQKNLRIINQNNPLSTYTVGFNKMKAFDNDTSETELVFNLNTEFSSNTFAFDTLTNTFRYRKNE